MKRRRTNEYQEIQSTFVVGTHCTDGNFDLVSMFSHKFSPRIVTAMNRVCGAVVVLYGVKLLADFVMAVL